MNVAALLAVVAAAAGRGEAASFRIVDEPTRTVVLEGRIELGDAAEFAALMREEGEGVTTLRLRSPGGHAGEAMRIDGMAHRLWLATEVPLLRDGRTWCPETDASPAACDCASACVFAWLAGAERHADAFLRVRAPSSLELPEAPAPNEARAAVVRYLDVFGVPAPLRDFIMSVPPQQMSTLDASTVARLAGFSPKLGATVANECPGDPRDLTCERRFVKVTRTVARQKWLAEQAQ